MKFLLLSLIGILITIFTFVSGPVTTTVLIAGSCFLAICILGVILYFIGKNDPRPRIGDVGYIEDTKVVVVAVFDSYFSIPDTIRAKPYRVYDQKDIRRPFVVGWTNNNKAILSPYFKPIHYARYPDQDHSDRSRNKPAEVRQK